MNARKDEKLELTGFSDWDWAGNIDSTSGYCFKLSNNSCAISWSRNMQNWISNSTAEVELNALVEASKEAKHSVKLLREMNLETQQPVNAFRDNQAFIALINNSETEDKILCIKIALGSEFSRKSVVIAILRVYRSMPVETLTKSIAKDQSITFRHVLLGTNT